MQAYNNVLIPLVYAFYQIPILNYHQYGRCEMTDDKTMLYPHTFAKNLRQSPYRGHPSHTHVGRGIYLHDGQTHLRLKCI